MKHYDKARILLFIFLAFAALAAFAPAARAQSTYFAGVGACSGCHVGQTTTSYCGMCHAHGVHATSSKTGINVTAVTNKTTYAPGETVSVTISGGYRPSTARAILYDQNGARVAISTGTLKGGIAPVDAPAWPRTLSAPAPATPGTYTWKAAWYGNRYDIASATFGPAGTGWIPDPNNANHGEERVSTNSFTVSAPQAPTITTASPLPAGTVGTPYSQTLVATGGTTPYSWSVTSGSLPAGLSLNVSTGAITGTPTVAATYNFTVQVTGGGSSAKLFALTINPVGAPTITTASPLPAGTVGTAYSQTLAATGGLSPYSWSISAGALPGGLSLNGSTGAITGTPTAAGTFNFTVQVTGTNSASSATLFALTINALPTPTITTASPLPAGTVGTAYSQTLAATGGTTPYSWSVSVGTLPAGLSLNASTGAITGTPTAAGTSEFTVQVTGANSASSTKAFALTINPVGAPTITTVSPLPGGVVGAVYSETLSATGGTAPYSWSVSAGTLPAGLSLSGSMGAITGTPTAPGTSDFTVQATGANNASSTQAFSLTVDAAAATAPPAESSGGCAIARSGGGIGEVAGAYGFLVLTALGMALRRRARRRKE